MVGLVLFVLTSFVLLFLEMVKHVIWLSWAAIGRLLPHNSSTFHASLTKEFKGEGCIVILCHKGDSTACMPQGREDLL